MKKTLLFIFLISSLTSCTKNEAQEKMQIASTAIPEKELVDTEKAAEPETITDLNNEIVLYFKEKNYAAIAEYIHPEKGLLFSMYLQINPQTDQHFTKEEFLNNLSADKQFLWGTKDGTGEAYKTTLKQYLEQWVFQKDFSGATVAENRFEKSGNTINNLRETFPDSQFTVNYLKGTSENAGMDWQNLIFVYETLNGKPFLIAIVNDKWTI